MLRAFAIIFAVSICGSFASDDFHTRDLVQYDESYGEKALGETLGGRGARIVYGTAAVDSQFTFYTYIIIFKDGSTSFCGGSLVSTTYVVTAAHCVTTATGAQAYFGSIDRNVMKAVRSVDTITYPSNYNTPASANDIAFLKLASAIGLTKYIGTIRLPKLSEAGYSQAGKSLVAVGFGQTATGYPRYLQYANLTGISLEVCQQTHWVAVASTLCAVGSDMIQSICFGDSGGPAIFYEADGLPTLVGISSFVQNNECTSNVQGFAGVNSFLSLIKSTTGVYLRS